MIHLNNISLAFGGEPLFADLSWHVKPQGRVGLVGPNGTGKSTLLKIISGRLKPDEGTVAMASATTVGYLSQDVQESNSENTVLQEALLAFEEILALERQEKEITDQLAAMTDHDSEAFHRLLHRLERVHAQLVGFDVDKIQSRAEEVLMGLGFEAEQLERPMHTFSGGWRMRVALAKLLLKQPDVLLLDEPTNHLDIESIDWVESYLDSYQGTVILVSHDRYFLDRMIRTTAELANGRITEYPGNYSYYLEAREERRILQQAAHDNQQKQIKDTERFIERFRYKATKARQVQSRIKALEKMERVAPPPSESASIHFRFPAPSRSGRVVLELSKFSKTYRQQAGEQTEVFKNAGPLKVERGDKVALIGKNGAGKSTLARMVLGTEPFNGERNLGHQVELTYFAQQQAEALDQNNTVLEEIRSHGRGQSDTQIRSILGAFLFTGDDVFKPISVLSGGEKNRVALARTLLKPANFMILDEPTNHLDIQSIRVLIEALKQYTGTFVVVSHDRHFLDQVANKVWHADHGIVRVFPGTYSEYRWSLTEGELSKQVVDRPAEAEPEASSEISQDESKLQGPKTKEQKRKEAEERNRRYRELKENGKIDVETAPSPAHVRKHISGLEQKILAAEERKEELELLLADPDFYADAAKSATTIKEYNSLASELAQLYEEWEELAQKVA